jgi:hypothetical protein
MKKLQVRKFLITVLSPRSLCTDFVCVNVIQPVEQLLHDLLDFSQTELYVDVRQEPGKVMMAELEDQVED